MASHHVFSVLFLLSNVSLGTEAKLESACLGHDDDCCTMNEPCPAGYGDCDDGHQCQAGLVCGENNCDPAIAEGNQNMFNLGDDCCTPRKTPCDGGDSCCTSKQPCDQGEGDCDNNSQCRGLLVCGRNNCVGSTFEDDDDCCKVIDETYWAEYQLHLDG